MALGVTAVTDKIVQAFLTEDKRKTFFHGHSFTANPLACSAALASLDLLHQSNTMACQENICRANLSFAEQLRTHPSALLNRIKDIRVLGTILAFEINQGQNEYLNQMSGQVTAFMMERGIYLRPLGNTVYIMPPYCLSDHDLHTLYDALTQYVDSLAH